MTVVAPASQSRKGYRAFPNIEARNFNQEMIEIPLMCLLLDLPLGVRVLEVGCGRGIALPPLTRKLAPRTLTAIDIDADLVEAAARHAGERGVAAAIERADVRSLPFTDGSFEVVIDSAPATTSSVPTGPSPRLNGSWYPAASWSMRR